MIDVVNIVLLTLLVITAILVIRQRDLFMAVMMTGAYSLLCAGLFVNMDAMDVAFTEAAVGVGVATVLMLGALTLVGKEERPSQRSRVLSLAVVTLTGAALLYGMTDIPPFGEASNPAQQHVATRYTGQLQEDVYIPNAVTAVLASYRGYDTMGETAVIFAAGVGVLLLLTGRRRSKGAQEGESR